jgi:hypothetical protein
VVEVATAPAEPVEVCDPEEVFELPEAAVPVPEADSEAPKEDSEAEGEEPEAESLPADVAVDEGAPIEDEAEDGWLAEVSRVVEGKVVELTKVVGDDTAAVVEDPVITALDWPVLEAWEVEAAVVETALLKLMYDGEYVAVPE